MVTQIGFGQQLARKQYAVPTVNPSFSVTGGFGGKGKTIGGPAVKGQGLPGSGVRVQPAGALVQMMPSPAAAEKLLQMWVVTVGMGAPWFLLEG
jgi:hypothetical protein